MNRLKTAQQLIDQLTQQINAMSEDEIMQQPNVVFFKSLHSHLSKIAPDLAKYAYKVATNLGDDVEPNVTEYLARSYALLIVAIDAKITDADVKEMVFCNLSISLE